MSPDEFIARFGVRCFWHFTDVRNLDSIRAAGGLLRLRALIARGVRVPAPGGNDWSHEADMRAGLDGYVHLCLMNDHPMEYRARQDGRIGTSRFLEVASDVLRFEGIRFTPDVANRSGVPLLTLQEAVEHMDFEVVYDRTDWRDPAIQERRKAAKRYELLIPADIPLNLLRGV